MLIADQESKTHMSFFGCAAGAGAQPLLVLLN